MIESETMSESSFNKTRYREIIGDCFDPDTRVFWRDFLFAYAAFIGGALGFLFLEWPLVQALSFLIAAFMAYRCSSYIHEIVHLPKERFKSFIIGWNALIGVPFLVPSILYESHLDHHIPRKYGTEQDPEYLPLAGAGFGAILWFIIHHAIVTPIILYGRMLVGLPIRLLSKKGADYLDRRLSSLVINWHYDRRNQARKKLLMMMEAYVLVITMLLSWAMVAGYLDPLLLPKLISIVVLSLTFNGIRTLAAHRYANKALQAVNAENQLLDSLNYEGPRWIGLLMAPVGLRFHALHHLFPTLPYHNLEEAHNKLMTELGEDDAYRKTVFTSFLKQLLTLTGDKAENIAGSVPQKLGSQA